jgi:hypothetical protein
MCATRIGPKRTEILVGILGLVVGCLIGWLAIGWGLWPVQYVGEAHTYELSIAEKVQYVAALADSYSLRQQIDVVHQRMPGWLAGDKVTALAELYAQYESQGAAADAQQVVKLTTALKQAEAWDANVVNQVLSDLAARYVSDGNKEHAQYISLFGDEIGLEAVGATAEATPTPPAEEPPVSSDVVGQLLPALVILLLAALATLVFLFLVRRRRARADSQPEDTPAGDELKPEVPDVLLSRRSTYRLGMDNFDESFSIEMSDGAFRGECGMGISEVMGDDTPRKVMAFEVWLFDKSDIRTVTKVLLSEYAYNNETLRNKLSARGEAILAQPGAVVLLETAALLVEATVAEVEHGAEPANSYFNTLTVSLVARAKPASEGS